MSTTHLLTELVNKLDDLTLAELAELQSRLDDVIEKKENQNVRQKIAEIHSIAESIGVTVEIHSSTNSDKDKRKKVFSKYVNFDNPDEAWSGRGTEPRWLSEKIKEGYTKEDFLMK
jgi:DNA-binding protein H-NS